MKGYLLPPALPKTVSASVRIDRTAVEHGALIARNIIPNQTDIICQHYVSTLCARIMYQDYVAAATPLFHLFRGALRTNFE